MKLLSVMRSATTLVDGTARKGFIRCVAVMLGWLCLVTSSGAETYSRDGLYEVDRYDLPNGLRVLLKPTQGMRNVSIRLVIGIGMDHYSCEDRELPHLLEHMMFSGTSEYSESELENLVSSWGAFWNAYTGSEQTEYHYDLYSGFQTEAISLLHQMITDTRFSEDRVANSRDVVHRESGYDDSPLFSWLFEAGLFRSAGTEFFVEMGATCPLLETAHHLDRDRLLDEWQKHYIASNMTLIVVGDIDPDLLAAIEATFGTLPSVEPQIPPLSAYIHPVKRRFEGVISPLYGDESRVGVAYLTSDIYAPDYYALAMVDRYLEEQLYDRLRVEAGITYTPGSSYSKDSRGGWLWGYADVAPEDEDQALQAIEQLFVELKEEGIDADSLRQLIDSDLLEYSVAYETNSGLADLYAASLFELKGDRFLNMEEVTAALTPVKIRQVIDENFQGAGYVIVKSPLVSFMQFLMIPLLLVVMLALVLWRQWKRRHHTVDASKTMDR